MGAHLCEMALPDVSFIGTNGTVWEHPTAIPAAGAKFLASKLEALAANEDLWNTTVFVINYDENDGFFDHVVPPTPDRDEFPEEFVPGLNKAGNTPGEGIPIGAGFRVPCFIISPWSTGGQVFSQVSDHTSCLRLIESAAASGGLSGRGPIRFPNVSRWRRKTFSDLTGALSGPSRLAPASREFLPSVRAANLAAQTASSKLPQPLIPARAQIMPTQVRK
jgi:phospholipase C